MIEEALGLGPCYYCIMRLGVPGFSARVYLLTQFLPHEKFCVHPAWGPPLVGPFDNSPQASGIGDAISDRRIPMDVPPFTCFICHDCFCDHMMDEEFGESILEV